MAKRFSDTDKWKKVWFRRLSPVHKVFWEYLRDNCNHAGIWDVDFELAQFQIGAELKPDEIARDFKNHIAVLSKKKWFLIDFIPYQYNCTYEELNISNRVHKSVIDCLKKYDMSKGLISPFDSAMDTLKDKDKDKDKDKNKKQKAPKKTTITKFKIPTKEEFTAYADEKKIPRSIAGDCWYYYDKIGWTIGKDKKPMVNWKSALSGWWNREKNKL